MNVTSDLPCLPCLPCPVPERLVVLTFDDAVSNHATFVGPLLKRYGFGATFYVCEFPDFATNKSQYMTWGQIRALHDMGFEIGNHTGHHAPVNGLSDERLAAELDYIDDGCCREGISRPVTFCYPCCGVSEQALAVLRARNYLFARSGGDRPYDPVHDDPLLVPSFQAHGTDPQVFHKALTHATAGQIVVLMFHGVPDLSHPWVSITQDLFERYVRYLAEERYTCLSLRDCVKYLGGSAGGVGPAGMERKREGGLGECSR